MDSANKEDRSLRVRPAVMADAEEIIRVHFAAVHGTASDFYPTEVLDGWSPPPGEARYERIRQAIDKGQERFVVAEDRSGVVGFGAIVPASNELRAVYVDPQAGRRGVGAAILRELECLAVSEGCGQLQMDASVNAEAFYCRHGYIVVARGVFPISNRQTMASVKMRKPVS